MEEGRSGVLCGKHEQEKGLELSSSGQETNPPLCPSVSQPSESLPIPSVSLRISRQSLHATVFLFLYLLPLSHSLRPFLLVITKEDFQDSSAHPPPANRAMLPLTKWEEFCDLESISEDDHNPGSWRPIFDPSTAFPSNSSDDAHYSLYFLGVRDMIYAASSGDPSAMEAAASQIEAIASVGFPHAQSTITFLYGTGLLHRHSHSKSFLYHSFAAKGGNM